MNSPILYNPILEKVGDTLHYSYMSDNKIIKIVSKDGINWTPYSSYINQLKLKKLRKIGVV